MSAPAPEAFPAGVDNPGRAWFSGSRFLAYKWAVGLGLAGLQSLVYFGLGYLQRPRSTTLIALPIDGQIPFLVWTVWLYLPFYAGIFALAITGIRRPALFHRALQGFLVTMLIGAIGHFAVAAEYPRPAVALPPEGASAAFLAWVQAVDPPGNVFPSLHVAHTTALAVILYRDRRGLGLVAMVMALLLALSTLTAKQHFLVDVLSGWLIAFFVSRWVLRPFPPAKAPRANRRPDPRPRPPE
jgi:membrane-associated phospholipid phosphatase